MVEYSVLDENHATSDTNGASHVLVESSQYWCGNPNIELLDGDVYYVTEDETHRILSNLARQGGDILDMSPRSPGTDIFHGLAVSTLLVLGIPVHIAPTDFCELLIDCQPTAYLVKVLQGSRPESYLLLIFLPPSGALDAFERLNQTRYNLLEDFSIALRLVVGVTIHVLSNTLAENIDEEAGECAAALPNNGSTGFSQQRSEDARNQLVFRQGRTRTSRTCGDASSDSVDRNAGGREDNNEWDASDWRVRYTSFHPPSGSRVTPTYATGFGLQAKGRRRRRLLNSNEHIERPQQLHNISGEGVYANRESDNKKSDSLKCSWSADILSPKSTNYNHYFGLCQNRSWSDPNLYSTELRRRPSGVSAGSSFVPQFGRRTNEDLVSRKCKSHPAPAIPFASVRHPSTGLSEDYANENAPSCINSLMSLLPPSTLLQRPEDIAARYVEEGQAFCVVCLEDVLPAAAAPSLSLIPTAAPAAITSDDLFLDPRNSSKAVDYITVVTGGDCSEEKTVTHREASCGDDMLAASGKTAAVSYATASPGVPINIICGHTFHSRCLRPWWDVRCPCCRFEQRLRAVPRCDICGYSSLQVRMCLSCGFLGCSNQPSLGLQETTKTTYPSSLPQSIDHSFQHFQSTCHMFALEVKNPKDVISLALL
jgi:hypothetical protein